MVSARQTKLPAMDPFTTNSGGLDAITRTALDLLLDSVARCTPRRKQQARLRICTLLVSDLAGLVTIELPSTAFPALPSIQVFEQLVCLCPYGRPLGTALLHNWVFQSPHQGRTSHPRREKIFRCHPLPLEGPFCLFEYSCTRPSCLVQLLHE